MYVTQAKPIRKMEARRGMNAVSTVFNLSQDMIILDRHDLLLIMVIECVMARTAPNNCNYSLKPHTAISKSLSWQIKPYY